MAIEIVSFPMKNGGPFHSFLYVYQAGYLPKTIRISGTKWYMASISQIKPAENVPSPKIPKITIRGNVLNY